MLQLCKNQQAAPPAMVCYPLAGNTTCCCCCPAGVVPACASLDCLTVFARSVDDGAAIMKVMEGASAGAADVWRRSSPAPLSYSPGAALQFKFAVPGPDFLDWSGPGAAAARAGWAAHQGSNAVTVFSGEAGSEHQQAMLWWPVPGHDISIKQPEIMSATQPTHTLFNTNTHTRKHAPSPHVLGLNTNSQ